MIAQSSQTIRLDFRPYEHQRAAHLLRLTFRFLVLVWHRRAGKTVWAIVELILAALSATRPRSRYAYICPLLKQAKSVAWDYLKLFAAAIPGVVVNEADLSVTFPNTAKVRLFGADNPDSLRGIYLDGGVLDEVADMKPNVWGAIIRPALADRQGWCIFIGTPKGVNLFSELYYRALKGDEADWHADLRRAVDTGVIPPEELDKARREMAPSEFAQEMECDFAAAVDNVLLKLDDVLAAQRRHVREDEYNFAGKVLAVDVARYGDDRSVIFARQGLASFQPKVFRGLDTMELAGQVAHSIEKWKPDACMVDMGAMGPGVADRLRQLKFNTIVGVDFGGKPMDARFENKRAEMWWELAEWVRAGGCLPNVEGLVSDLTAPTFTYKNARGRLQLESKDDMRKRGLPSPDLGDALAMTFAFPVMPRHTSLGARDVHKALTEYDPHALPSERPTVARAAMDYDQI